MWLFLRILVTFVVVVSRLIYRLTSQPALVAGQLEGKPYAHSTKVNSKGEQDVFQIGAPLPSSVWFELKAESSFDRWCKRWSLVEEFQTGDAEFDQHIYLGADSPAIQQLLASNTESRQLILQLLVQQKFCRIWSDGQTLWAKKKSPQPADPNDIAIVIQLATLFGAAATVSKITPPLFFWRYLVVESLTYSFFGYAAVVVLEQRFLHPDIHLAPYQVFYWGLVAALLLFCLLLLFTWLLLRGSSKAHLLLLETALLLALALPLCGIDAVSLLNRSFDTTRAEVFKSPVLTTELKHHHRTSRGRYSFIGLLLQPTTTYHLQLKHPPTSFGQQSSAEIEVSEELYRQAKAGSIVQLSIKPGWLGLPWFQRISVIK